MLKQFLLVAAGGALGSILRYATSLLTAKSYSNAFPLATFLANIIGCFLIGIFISLWGFHTQSNSQLKLLWITGFCGGYTTFSAFSLESLHLIENYAYTTAFLYITASIIAGIIAVWLGILSVKVL